MSKALVRDALSVSFRIPVLGYFSKLIVATLSGPSVIERNSVQFTVLESRLRELHAKAASTVTTLQEFQEKKVELERLLGALEEYHDTLPGIHNAISSSQSFQRELKRSHDELKNQMEFLRGRVEFVREELLFEFRYSGAPAGGAPSGIGSGTGSGTGPSSTVPYPRQAKTPVTPKVTAPDRLAQLREKGMKLNIGCGHKPMLEYLNVDQRELPGVDLVAAAEDLPFERESVEEIFSAHLIEHFPEEELKRKLLPYWHGLLKPGGVLRAVVPDWEVMMRQWVAGVYPFEQLRRVTFGAQDYEGDFHFNMFSQESLRRLLEEAGYSDVSFPVTGRVNGDCFEMEVRATK